ncbi:unnamed protein product [Protopolystoma xenopodis]|uniref:Uncharacterized protein n=1 Tax=Protopolystoma xenopodis TaxID=117903 RepID=A0A448WLA6_9PLAT|nr:unnamed protein product [Protopolystoma xenopodis]
MPSIFYLLHEDHVSLALAQRARVFGLRIRVHLPYNESSASSRPASFKRPRPTTTVPRIVDKSSGLLAVLGHEQISQLAELVGTADFVYCHWQPSAKWPSLRQGQRTTQLHSDKRGQAATKSDEQCQDEGDRDHMGALRTAVASGTKVEVYKDKRNLKWKRTEEDQTPEEPSKSGLEAAKKEESCSSKMEADVNMHGIRHRPAKGGEKRALVWQTDEMVSPQDGGAGWEYQEGEGNGAVSPDVAGLDSNSTAKLGRCKERTNQARGKNVDSEDSDGLVFDSRLFSNFKKCEFSLFTGFETTILSHIT